jgi:O-antigen/teichoic acid export membrane protein
VRKFLERLQGTGHGATLARGAIGAFTVKVTGAGLLFALHVLLAILLGVVQYGIYVYAITWVNILAILCLLGFQTSLVRFIAEYNAKQQWGILRGIIRRSNQTVLGCSILVGIIGSTITLFLKERLSGGLAITFYIAFGLLPIFALCRLQEASLRGLKCVVQSELLLRFIRPVLLALIVAGLFFWTKNSLSAASVMAGNVVAVVGVFLTGTVLLRKALPEPASQAELAYAQRQWLKVSLPLLLIAGMHIILKRTDIIMIGAILGPDDAGIYSAASRISDLVVFGLVAINSILAPMISELYHTGKKQELQRIITIAARAIFVFTLMVSVILAVIGKFLLSLFGLEFIVAFVPLLVLLCGQIVNALTGSVALIMTMTGYQNKAGAIVAISAGINVLLNVLLIPLMGLAGAAISTAFTMVLWNLAMLTFVRRRIGINSSVIRFVSVE